MDALHLYYFQILLPSIKSYINMYIKNVQDNNWLLYGITFIIISVKNVICIVLFSHNEHPCLQVSAGFRATVLKCAFEGSLVSLPEMYNNKKN